eukprot:1156188-Pelagomonas_calceolata.AAC.1
MLFTKQRNFQVTAEYMCAPFPAGCRRIGQFASEHHLTDRPHTMLWLTKAYALPASMYAGQIWGTRFMKGAEMGCPLQIVHLCLLKRILGQLGFTMFYCAATALHSATIVNPLNADALAEHGELTNKLAKYDRWMALPLRPLSFHGAPFPVPRGTHLLVTGINKEDSRMKNMPCSFALVCFLRGTYAQEKKDCACQVRPCALRKGHLSSEGAQLFSDSPPSHKNFLDESGAFFYSQASSEDVFHFLQKQANDIYRFISEFMGIFCAVEQAEQPKYLAEGTFNYSQASSEDVFHFLQKQANETYRFISDFVNMFCAVGTVEQAEQPNYLAEGQNPLKLLPDTDFITFLASFHVLIDLEANAFLNQDSYRLPKIRQNRFQSLMLDENVSPAADQPDYRAVGQPPSNPCNPFPPSSFCWAP